jgi:hypothetical protein
MRFDPSPPLVVCALAKRMKTDLPVKNLLQSDAVDSMLKINWFHKSLCLVVYSWTHSVFIFQKFSIFLTRFLGKINPVHRKNYVSNNRSNTVV